MAVEYDRVMKSPRGRARTVLTGELVARARAAAVNARLGGPELYERCTRFGKAPPGERIVTLTLIEALQTRDCFPAVLDGIGNSRSGFEQYRALGAAQSLLPSLDAVQRAQLLHVIDEQRGQRGYITSDPVRLALADQITGAIDGRTALS